MVHRKNLRDFGSPLLDVSTECVGSSRHGIWHDVETKEKQRTRPGTHNVGGWIPESTGRVQFVVDQKVGQPNVSLL